MVANSTLTIRHAQILLPDGDFITGDMQVSGGTIAQVATMHASASVFR